LSQERPDITGLALRKLIGIADHPNVTHNYKWDIMHFFAQVEGCFYSFRILKQIVGLLLVCNSKEQLPEAISLLHGHLSSLPSLETRRSHNLQYSLTELHEMETFLNSTYAMLGVQDNTTPTTPEDKGRKRRKGERKTTLLLLSSILLAGSN